MRIEQVRFSGAVRFFEQGFLDRWNIQRYHCENSPALFVGVYDDSDVEAINRHKGFKVIWNAGTTRPCFEKINPKNTVVWVGNGVPFYNANYKMKHVNIEIKDFSMFTPSPLGNKVYWYMGIDALKQMYHYDLYLKVKEICDFEIITGFLGNSMEWIKTNCYDQAFVNIKPAVVEGYTTSTEMAFMGRYSIGRGQNHWNKNFGSAHEVLVLINEEAKKIGTMPSSLIGDYFTKDDWQQVDFWL
jgi:hypothetical protein